MDRFPSPQSGDANRFRDYGSGDPDVDANDDLSDETHDAQGNEISPCCGTVIDTDIRICPTCKEHV